MDSSISFAQCDEVRHDLPKARVTERPYDLVIFAATGSVGKFLVEEMALVVKKFYPTDDRSESQQPTHNGKKLRSPSQFAQTRRSSVPRQVEAIKWAVAGRSAVKLSETLCRAELSTGIGNLSVEVPVLLADLNHPKSLVEMCSKTGLVVNCAGPYTSGGGEPVIRACLKTGTNYIDLSHEDGFIEQVRRKYSEEARRACVCIINGCGFQSMSAEMGLNFCKQVADGQVEEVKVILNLSDTRPLAKTATSQVQAIPTGTVSWGMWCALIAEQANLFNPPSSSTKLSRKEMPISDGNSLKQLQRQDTQSLVLKMAKFRSKSTSIWLKLICRGFDECGRRYCLPVGSLISDESQLVRSEMANYEFRTPALDSDRGWSPVRCASFIAMKSFHEAILFLVWLIVFHICVRFSLFRKLMTIFPALCSFGHVNAPNSELDRESLSHIKFCQTFLAYGTPGEDSGDPLERREKYLKRKQDQLLISRIVGPEPNHVATATFAIQAALTVTLERDHLPLNGGVLTPGAAFAETNIIHQLRRRNIKFEVMKKA